MGELISRQALLNKFEPWLKVKDYSDGELNMLKAILYEIRFIPSATDTNVGTKLGTDLAEVGTDLISRQAAIDYFVTNVGFHDEDGYPIEDECELREIWTGYFDGIPSAEPHWIPCSERLPKAKQKVLVQYADESMATKRCNDEGHLQWFYANAVAWMPAPEPYKEVTE